MKEKREGCGGNMPRTRSQAATTPDRQTQEAVKVRYAKKRKEKKRRKEKSLKAKGS